MSIWNNVTLSSIYTLSPTHCGVGQAMGALDLPIARDVITNFPVLPATSLKGVARDYMNKDSSLEKRTIDRLFGKSLEDAEKDENVENMAAGAIAFTEARLVAFPIRSLNRPFLHVTCPLIIEQLQRDLRVLGLADFLPEKFKISSPDAGKIHVTDSSLSGKTLILEDLVYPQESVGLLPSLGELAQKLAKLLPINEDSTRQRLIKGLVMVPDEDFAYLMQQATSVRARIKLTGGKTTTPWRDPDTGEQQKGNLWYEESLPSDCLFISFLGERRQQKAYQDNRNINEIPNPNPPMEIFKTFAGCLEVVQLGGNETVGYGLCLWNFRGAEGEQKQ